MVYVYRIAYRFADGTTEEFSAKRTGAIDAQRACLDDIVRACQGRDERYDVRKLVITDNTGLERIGGDNA